MAIATPLSKDVRESMPPAMPFTIPKSACDLPEALTKRRLKTIFDPQKPTLNSLDNDMLVMVFKALPIPSRICLGLTNKFFAGLTHYIDTTIKNELPVHKHDDSHRFPTSVYVGFPEYKFFLSTRRMLLLQLRDWMPRGYRLCWICCKYSLKASSKWDRSERKVKDVQIDGASSNRYKHRDLHRHAYCRFGDEGKFGRFITKHRGLHGGDEVLCKLCKDGAGLLNSGITSADGTNTTWDRKS